jgi:hypothetical protein
LGHKVLPSPNFASNKPRLRLFSGLFPIKFRLVYIRTGSDMIRISSFCIFAVLVILCVGKPGTGYGKRVEGKLNVHLVSHTHDDVGWLKVTSLRHFCVTTPSDCRSVFLRSKQLYSICGSTVRFPFPGYNCSRYILDTVIPCLVDNPNRKFVYVEQAFFQRWWHEQSSVTQQTVKYVRRSKGTGRKERGLVRDGLKQRGNFA